MFKNYLKIVLRNLWKYKGYTLLNVLGMAVGIAGMVWGFQTYRFGYSFDNFHIDRDKIYRALTYKDGGDGVKGVFPMAAVQLAKNDFSGIEAAVRYDSRGLNIRHENNEPFAEQAYYTDPEFFTLFNFPLVSGNTDLRNKNAVIITEQTAKKYFGAVNPLGKSLTFYSGETYAMPLTVTGVLKDIPVNSSMQFDFITSFENYLKADGKKIEPGDWTWFLDAAFFKIPNPADAQRLAGEMKKYLPVQNKAREDWKASGFSLITMNENAKLSDISSNSLNEKPDDSAIYGPFILAFLIFLSACLNFSNTTVSRANRRLKEIGMRKVMGSSHRQLIIQILLECGFIVVLALLVSVLLNKLWFPTFNSMFSGIKIEADYFTDIPLLLFLGFAVLLTTLMAGAYPAFYISRFNPSTIFRGTVKFGGNNLFSRLMLGLQLSIAIITVIASIGFARNSEFQKNYDYGYNINNTIGVYISDSSLFASYQNEIASIPQVNFHAGTLHHITYYHRMMVTESEGLKKESNYYEVGRDYIKTMNLSLVQGRAFDAAMEGDYIGSVLINQKLAAQYGWKEKDALGKQMRIDSMNLTVVGVLKDFQQDALFDPVEPVAMKLAKDSRHQMLIIQATTPELTTVFGKAKDAWKKIFPTKPFTGFYQNEIRAEAGKVTKSITKIFFWFAIISILLTATGLFALVSLTVLKKTKEIALRKIVGASGKHILVLINRGYFWIFIIAAAIGCYGGWALTGLLLNMIFDVNSGISSATLVNAVLVLFLIAGITSGIKVWQAIRTNPVKSLRTE